MLWTRLDGRGKTVGRQVAAEEVKKVCAELARHAEFIEISQRIAAANERICVARPAADTLPPSVPEGEKGLRSRRAAWSAEIGRLAGEAARGLAPGGASLAAAEAVIREGVLRLGGGILGELLSADPGYRGPAVASGNGHEAVHALRGDEPRLAEAPGLAGGGLRDAIDSTACSTRVLSDIEHIIASQLSLTAPFGRRRESALPPTSLGARAPTPMLVDQGGRS